jgi:hypothetical protein
LNAYPTTVKCLGTDPVSSRNRAIEKRTFSYESRARSSVNARVATASPAPNHPLARLTR